MATNGGVRVSEQGLAILHLTLYMYNLMDVPRNIQCINIKVVITIAMSILYVYMYMIVFISLHTFYYNHVIIFS